MKQPIASLVLLGGLFLATGCSQTPQTPIASRPESSSEESPHLKLQQNSQALPASEVQLTAIATGELTTGGTEGTETQTGGPVTQLDSSTAGANSQTSGESRTSQVESQPVAISETTAKEIISEVGGQQTDEGLLITLPENILFDFDESNIRTNAQPTLRKIAQLIQHYKDAPVEINGHTDSKGSDSYNQTLSERRADAVKTYLVNNFRINASRLTAKGFGESQPVAPNENSGGSDNPQGRQQNRRVELVIKN
jgi:photosystem I P700 chlorophyll a apoprotein A2